MKHVTKQLTFSEEDILDYVNVSGDDNPIHTSADEAKKMGFETCPVHGMLVMAKVGSYASEITGKKCWTNSFTVRFQTPVYVQRQYELKMVRTEEQDHHLTLCSLDGSIVLKGKITLTEQ
ncbi:MaoC family dehydratase [Pseudalkalibacillus berkeleyi]|uniref:MaoC family dehydratase n=1 Tax=Pseudalkalibacillus berkeleyi TaxID=1069813 RepID=A0ABS9H047_9BACL|nr:MaoC family dehydratase [Pseudalkalibacillus berkeleyi]MCF6138377.1 MaoC family dehydratase [Pseudalkalibacillus berkeleyi]